MKFGCFINIAKLSCSFASLDSEFLSIFERVYYTVQLTYALSFLHTYSSTKIARF